MGKEVKKKKKNGAALLNHKTCKDLTYNTNMFPGVTASSVICVFQSTFTAVCLPELAWDAVKWKNLQSSWNILSASSGWEPRPNDRRVQLETGIHST